MKVNKVTNNMKESFKLEDWLKDHINHNISIHKTLKWRITQRKHYDKYNNEHMRKRVTTQKVEEFEDGR